MRILFANSIASNVWGGGEKWMILAGTGLQSRGHSVWIACRPGSVLYERAKQSGLRTLEMKSRGDLNPGLTGTLYRFLKSNRIDVLIPNLMKDVRVAGLAGRLAGTPLILARQGLVLCRKRLRYHVSFRLFTDGLIVNSQAIKNTYESYGWFKPGSIHLVYNGVHLPGPEVPCGKDLYFMLILGAGRLDPQKNFPFLIRVAAMARDRDKPWTFAIAGEGPQRGELEQLIAEHKLAGRFHLLGFQDDLQTLLRRCSVFVLPSSFEGMPNVAMEAMAAGKPIVAASVDGVRDLVVHGETGFLSEKDDADAFYRYLDLLMSNPELRDEMGSRGSNRMRIDFTVDCMISALEKIFSGNSI